MMQVTCCQTRRTTIGSAANGPLLDPGASLALRWRGAGDRCGTRARIEANQDEAGEMAERIRVGFDHLPGPRPAPQPLLFARPPAGPQKLRRLLTVEPAVAWLSPGWQDHVDDAAMDSNTTVMDNGRTQVLQVAAGSAPIAACLDVG